MYYKVYAIPYKKVHDSLKKQLQCIQFKVIKLKKKINCSLYYLTLIRTVEKTVMQ